MPPMRVSLLAIPVAFLITACGGSDPDVVEQGPRQSAGSDESSQSSDEPQGQMVESGFGQSDGSALAVVLVKNTADHGGQTVTVSVNFLDASGKILATESQVDSFDFAGQTIAAQVETYDVKGKIASIEPTLLVEDEGTFEEDDFDLGTAEATNLAQEYGSWSGDFLVKNPTSEALESPAVRVACRDASGTIIGGGYTFPDLLPPNGEVVANVSLTVSSAPKSCTAYVGGPIY